MKITVSRERVVPHETHHVKPGSLELVQKPEKATPKLTEYETYRNEHGGKTIVERVEKEVTFWQWLKHILGIQEDTKK